MSFLYICTYSTFFASSALHDLSIGSLAFPIYTSVESTLLEILGCCDHRAVGSKRPGGVPTLPRVSRPSHQGQTYSGTGFFSG